jgi:hypothetical protein
VTRLHQCDDGMASDEPGAAGDQNSHPEEIRTRRGVSI